MRRVLFYDDVPIHGGHQVTAIAAARHLSAAGLEVMSAFPASNERLHAAWRSGADSVQLFPLDLRLTRWQPFLSPFGIAAAPVRKLLQRVQPDIVVAVQGTVVQSNRVVEQSRKLSIPVVSFVPMGVHFAPGLWFQKSVSRVIERYHYMRPNGFITTSETSRRELVAGGARPPIEVTYYGIDVARLRRVPREEARVRLGITQDRYLMLHIGRVSMGTKGHDVLLHALASPRALLADASLLIVGDGPDDHRLDRMIRDLALEPVVRRLPWLEDMTDIYSAADMVIIPSRFEGLPLVAIEAMHYGLPIVATRTGALPEVLPSSWLCPIGDATALAETMGRVRSEITSATLQANRERVAREFNEAHFGERFAVALGGLYETSRRVSR